MRPAAIEQVASLVAPPLCAACGSPRPLEAVICERCEADLASAPRVIEPGPPGVDLAVAASPFDGVARQVVHGLKYARRLALAQVAAAAMLRALPDREPAGVVVPVPAGPLAMALARLRPGGGDRDRNRRRGRAAPERVPAARRRPAPGRAAALGAARGPARGLGRVDVPARGAARRRRLDDGRDAGGLRQGAARGRLRRVVALTLARTV